MNDRKVETILGIVFFAGLFIVATLIISAKLLGYL
jgi:hypothetical protein